MQNPKNERIMDGTTLDIKQDQLTKLKELFPEAITEGKVDWEKLKASLGENINFNNERYVLNWAGKSDAFKILQLPTTDTLQPEAKESINFETTQNIFIEGENLRVLKTLQKSYYNKIKCIIIDPPYNTGGDSFIYPDKFSEKKEDYQKRIGDKDEEGYMMKEGLFHKNSKDGGHYHSNWLSMMYPRLFLAKNLLRTDGAIFVHIDDNEIHNLRMIMNEIFGEENFLAQIVWQKKYAVSNDDTGISATHEYILGFQKSNEFTRLLLPRSEKQLTRYSNADKDPRGDWASGEYVSSKSRIERPTLWYPIIHPKTGEEVWPDENAVWRYSREKHEQIVLENRLYWGPDQSYKKPRLKRFLNEIQDGVVPSTWWPFEDVGHNDEAQKETAELLGKKIFSTPKPLRLIKKIISITSNFDKEDIILDFFSGSGTTAQAVLELNKDLGGTRRFIMVQLPELIDAASDAGKEGYNTIADITKERIQRTIKSITKEAEYLKNDISNLDNQIQETKNQIANEKQKLNPELFNGEAASKEILSLEKQLEKLNVDLSSKQSQLGKIEKSDNGFAVFKLRSSNFKIWRSNEINEDNLSEQLNAFTNPVEPGSENQNMLYELALKSGHELTSSIKYYDSAKLYIVNQGELIIALDSINKDIVESIVAFAPKKVLALDNLFSGNDQLKTNTVLQMKDAGIDFKTI